MESRSDKIKGVKSKYEWDASLYDFERYKVEIPEKPYEAFDNHGVRYYEGTMECYNALTTLDGYKTEIENYIAEIDDAQKILAGYNNKYYQTKNCLRNTDSNISKIKKQINAAVDRLDNGYAGNSDSMISKLRLDIDNNKTKIDDELSTWIDEAMSCIQIRIDTLHKITMNNNSVRNKFRMALARVNRSNKSDSRHVAREK